MFGQGPISEISRELTVLVIRSLGLVPQEIVTVITKIAAVLTIAIALGLGVDVRVVARTGPRATLAVTASLIFLGLMSYELIRMVGMP